MLNEPSIRLREAIIEGNLLTVKRLLRLYPDLLTNIDPSNGWSSLHYASFHGRYLVCVLLIQLGHDKHEIIKTFKGNTCVHLSLMKGHEQTTHLLIQHFPNFINFKGDMGRTPTHIACLNDYYQCLSLLVGVGAKLNRKDNMGDTPLHLCMQYGSINCIKMLIQELNFTLNDEDSSRYKNKNHWRPSDVAVTFEMRKIYYTVVRENELNGNKPSHSTRGNTPILNSKNSNYDEKRFASPVVSLKSFHGVPGLPQISTSRRGSLGLELNDLKTPTLNLSMFRDREMTTPIFSSSKKTDSTTSASVSKSDSSTISPFKIVDFHFSNTSTGSSPLKILDNAISNNLNFDINSNDGNSSITEPSNKNINNSLSGSNNGNKHTNNGLGISKKKDFTGVSRKHASSNSTVDSGNTSVLGEIPQIPQHRPKKNHIQKQKHFDKKMDDGYERSVKYGDQELFKSDLEKNKNPIERKKKDWMEHNKVGSELMKHNNMELINKYLTETTTTPTASQAQTPHFQSIHRRERPSDLDEDSD